MTGVLHVHSASITRVDREYFPIQRRVQRGISKGGRSSNHFVSVFRFVDTPDGSGRISVTFLMHEKPRHAIHNKTDVVLRIEMNELK